MSVRVRPGPSLSPPSLKISERGARKRDLNLKHHLSKSCGAHKEGRRAAVAAAAPCAAPFRPLQLHGDLRPRLGDDE